MNVDNLGGREQQSSTTQIKTSSQQQQQQQENNNGESASASNSAAAAVDASRQQQNGLKSRNAGSNNNNKTTSSSSSSCNNKQSSSTTTSLQSKSTEENHSSSSYELTKESLKDFKLFQGPPSLPTTTSSISNDRFFQNVRDAKEFQPKGKQQFNPRFFQINPETKKYFTAKEMSIRNNSKDWNQFKAQRRIYAKIHNNAVKRAWEEYNNFYNNNNNIESVRTKQQQQQQQVDVSGSGSSNHPLLSQKMQHQGSNDSQHQTTSSKHVRQNNMGEEGWSAEQSNGVSPRHQQGTTSSSERRSSHQLHSGSSSSSKQQVGTVDGVNTTGLRQESQVVDAGTSNGGIVQPSVLHQKSASNVGEPISKTGARDDSTTTSSPSPQLNNGSSSQGLHLSGLQNSKSMGGSSEASEGKLHHQPSKSSKERNSSLLGVGNQNVASQAVSTRQLHGSGGRTESSNDEASQVTNFEVKEGSVVVSQVNQPNADLVQEGQVAEESDMPLVQTNNSGQAGGIRGSGSSGLSSAPCARQTSRQTKSSLSRINNSLHQQQGSSRQNVRYSKSNSFALDLQKTRDAELAALEHNRWMDLYDYIQSRSKHTFVRKTHSSSSPTAEQNDTIRLHSHDVSDMVLYIDRVRELMSDNHRNRFDELWKMTFHDTFAYLKNTITAEQQARLNADAVKNSTYLKKHAARLVSDSICRNVAPSDTVNNVGQNTCFNVLELDSDGQQRLRAITWTHLINDYLAEVANYQPQMSQLQAPGYFIDDVRRETAGTGDCKISFYQVLIPEEVRRMFRFCDNEGNWYELLRLPMGLRTSAEMMQLIVETISGKITAVKPTAVINGQTVKLASTQTRTSVWIDGFRSAGSAAEVKHDLDRIRLVGKYVNITWKGGDISLTDEYDFIGIHFNHKTHVVSVAQKTVSKLPKSYSYDSEVLITDLEKDISRLFFCSSVLRIVPGNYFYAMKWVNRQVSKLNRGTPLDTTVSLPRSVCDPLNKWLKAAKSSLTLLPDDDQKQQNRNNNNDTLVKYDLLFTDASKFGWGAYLVTSDSQVAIIGGKWNEQVVNPSAEKIAELEARALFLALEYFKQRLLRHKNVDIRIDNTSVVAAVEKGKSKTSPTLNAAIVDSVNWLVENDFSFSVSYVNTKDNWADKPSRGKMADSSFITDTEVKKFYSNRGSRGRLARDDFSSFLFSSVK